MSWFTPVVIDSLIAILKAIVILLTLLSLGIKGIRVGPSVPGFLTPNLLNFLSENFDLKTITTVEQDLKDILAA